MPINFWLSSCPTSTRSGRKASSSLATTRVRLTVLPGRGTFVTGLYAYQTNLFLTRESTSNPYDTKQPQPRLQPEFETYGKLLFEAGYDTPYIGKWHLSDSPESPTSPGADNYLNEYGFKGLTIPDPLGMPAQGLGLTKPQYQGAPPLAGDPEIAAQAVNWLFARAQNNTKPSA